MLREIRAACETKRTPLVISGAIGPRGDGYAPGVLMRADDAQDYHAWQIGVLKGAGADLVSAFTLTNIGEAVGIACAAKAAGIPCVISFTLETDGRLPTGETLGEAIEAVDRATNREPAYYMINCAHPAHFSDALEDGAAWTKRLRGLRANASRKSHAELDASTELDAGNPEQLGELYAELLCRFPHINVLGGCCGTDHLHVECISASCLRKKPDETTRPNGSRRGFRRSSP
jgi:S-methylmethionine-dependent homocysteine/selenocysteine methylase